MQLFRQLILLVLIGLLAACDSFADSANRTATPERPDIREAVYTEQSGEITLTLQEITLLEGESDAQILAVLADGQGNLAYVLYPSNQPGVVASAVDLSAYPLQLDSSSETIALWVMAVKHNAYPVAENIGLSELAAELATVFNRIFAQDLPSRAVSSAVVAGADDALLDWFGEVDILGEVAFALSPLRDTGEYTIDSSDGGIRVLYTVSMTSPEIAPTTSPSEATSPYPENYAGYEKIIDEDFAGSQSALTWFQERDELYTVLFNDDTYEVALTKLGEETQSVISWGSIQQIVLDDYIIRAKMTLLEPGTIASYGLWLHYLNENNFLSFALNHEGEYRIMRYQSRDVVLVPWTADEAVNVGGETNIVEVRLSGEQYTMLVNGKELATVTDDEFEDGRIAFYCYAEEVPATCQLDEIEVWIPENSVSPLVTVTPSN